MPPRTRTGTRTKTRPTFLETLRRNDRELLLRFAAKTTKTAPVHVGTSKAAETELQRVKDELDGHEHELFGDEDMDAGVMARATTNAPAMYMKTIWELRHRLQTSNGHNKALEQRLQGSEEAVERMREQMAQNDKEHREQITRLASQLEQLISADQSSARRLSSHLATEQRLKAELDAANNSQERLRELLRAEMQRSEQAEQPLHSRAWQQLASAELVRESEPPRDFPTPKPLPFTAATFQSLTLLLKKTTKERDELQDRCEKLKAKNDELVLSQAQTGRENKRKLDTMHHQLSGAVRRIQWLLSERDKLVAKAKKADLYASRIEQKLLRHHTKTSRRKTRDESRTRSTPKQRQAPIEAAVDEQWRHGRGCRHDDGDDVSESASDSVDRSRSATPQTTERSSRSSSGSPTRQLQRLSSLVENLMRADVQEEEEEEEYDED